jgi:L-ascorbate metabolism protein UlaG (beta-lactamase superfamily)
MDIKYQGISICVDPAKITPQELETLNPDLILISHESMDHMDPIQVYQLQKRKNCKIFCNIASAVDLIQYYFQDTEFIDSINVMLPNSTTCYKDIKITAAISKHCDYMLPVIFRLDFLKCGHSVLHCIDTLIYENLDEISKGVDVSIIPIGIAKGVSAKLGMDFINKLKSSVYTTNHFTDQNEELKTLVAENTTLAQNGVRVHFTDWNESCEISPGFLNKNNIETITKNKFNKKSLNEIISSLNNSESLENDLILIIEEFNYRKSKLMKKELVACLSEIYKSSNEKCKSLILMILSIVSVYDNYLIGMSFIDLLSSDLAVPINNSNEELKSSILFFLGIFSQQSAKIYHLKELSSNASIENEHVAYWVVECLGRMGTSKSDQATVAAEELLKIVKQDELFNSVIVRRRIFWEFHRLMKLKPSLGSMFIKYFSDGLCDSNPDVRLLAELCIGVLSRTCDILDSDVMKKFVELDKDVEDDVREIFVRCWIMIHRYHPTIFNDHRNRIENLLNDSNCHVRRAATEALACDEN